MSTVLECVLRILILIVLFSCMATNVFAKDYEAIVQRAFESNDQASKQDWSFTETRLSEGVTRVSRFDPRRPDGERWALISVDGNPPTRKEIEQYLQEKRESDDSQEEGDEFGSKFIAPGSLKLIEETEVKYRFGFLPNIEEDSEEAKLWRHVNGILSIDKSGHYIESIDLKSIKPFKPAKGIKVKSFEMSMKFGPAANDSQIVPLLFDVHVQGRAFLMFKLNEAERISYSDYILVTE